MFILLKGDDKYAIAVKNDKQSKKLVKFESAAMN